VRKQDFYDYLDMQVKVKNASNSKENDILEIIVASAEQTDTPKDVNNGFHLIQEFFIFTSDDYRKRRIPEVPMPLIEARQKEFNYVLQRNLNNNLTESLTILHNNDSSLRPYLKSLNLTNSDKLNLVNIRTEPSVQNLFLYINHYMIGKMIMMIHMDNVLGAGVELIDVEKFNKEDLCYALTRTLEPGACSDPAHNRANVVPHCSAGSEYCSSHDVYAFVLKKKRPATDFGPLNFDGDVLGQENIIIWFFRDVLQYRVLNPCKVVNIYHQHCTFIDTSGRTQRVFVHEGWERSFAPFTDQLF